MEPDLALAIEMHEWAWKNFRDDLRDVTPEEIDWRPLPQANSINLIVRHLRIEAAWHVACLEQGQPMPFEVTPELQQGIDAVPLDFERNLKELEQSFNRFIAALRGTSSSLLQQQTTRVYQGFGGEASRPAHFLGFHQLMHLAMHWGQIRTIRNLYRKTRGEPARFFPENPSYPDSPIVTGKGK